MSVLQDLEIKLQAAQKDVAVRQKKIAKFSTDGKKLTTERNDLKLKCNGYKEEITKIREK